MPEQFVCHFWQGSFLSSSQCTLAPRGADTRLDHQLIILSGERLQESLELLHCESGEAMEEGWSFDHFCRRKLHWLITFLALLLTPSHFTPSRTIGEEVLYGYGLQAWV